MKYKLQCRKNELTKSKELPALVLCEAFILVTLILSLAGVLSSDKPSGNALICLMVSLLLLMPWVFEHCFKLYMPILLKVMFMLLIIGGPILGKIYRFYYIVPLWDKLLHTSSGFLFAVIGAMIPQVLDEKNSNHSQALVLTCAMCFTLAIAVIWEFFEFGMDRFFGMDMQQDTWITDINSYLLGTEKGSLGSIYGINSLIINGEQIATQGYLDIGLIDTMHDMLVCALGGLIYCVCNVLYHKSVKALSWFSNIIPVKSDNCAVTACETESLHSEN